MNKDSAPQVEEPGRGTSVVRGGSDRGVCQMHSFSASQDLSLGLQEKRYGS